MATCSVWNNISSYLVYPGTPRLTLAPSSLAFPSRDRANSNVRGGRLFTNLRPRAAAENKDHAVDVVHVDQQQKQNTTQLEIKPRRSTLEISPFGKRSHPIHNCFFFFANILNPSELMQTFICRSLY